MRQTIIFLLLLFFGLTSSNAQSLEELQQQRKKTEESIALTNRLLNQNSKSKNQELSNLKLLSSKITYRKKLIQDINKELTELDNIINTKNEVIETYETDLDTLKGNYAKMLQHIWTRRSSYDQWMYVLAGQDIAQIYRRFRYLNEFSKYQKSQAESIQELTARVSAEKEKLEVQKQKQASLIKKYNSEAQTLKNEQATKNEHIKSLDSNKKKLSKQLASHQKKYKELGRFVDKLIAKEVKKTKKDASGKMELTPEQKMTSAQFADNKGKLPWPVANGIIDEGYGAHASEVYKRVKIENNGVDIRTDKGSNARSVFEGEVTSVMALPGFNKGVIVRHGNYLTLYANLIEVYVKTGDKISTKQKLGKIFTDSDNKTILTFQIFKEKAKQNPQLWLSK